MRPAGAVRGGGRGSHGGAALRAAVLPALLVSLGGTPSPLWPQAAALAGRDREGTYASVVQDARRALDARQWARAAALWQRALVHDGRVAEHWYALGLALLNDGRPREAIVAFEYTRELVDGGRGDLSDAAAWNIARAHAVLGERGEALWWFRVAGRGSG